MRIGQMAEKGSNRRPKWFAKIHKREKRKRHTAEELAADTGFDKSSILKGAKGLIVPEEEMDGRQKKFYFLEEDLQWLEDEVAAGRIYPIRAVTVEPAEDDKTLHEILDELIECSENARDLAAVEDIEDNDSFRKLFRKTRVARNTIVDLLTDASAFSTLDVGRMAEAGLLASRLSESIGRSQKRWDKLQEKKR